MSQYDGPKIIVGINRDIFHNPIFNEVEILGKTLLTAILCCKLIGSLPLIDDFRKAQEIAALYEKPLAIAFNLDEALSDKLFSNAMENEFIFVKDKGGEQSISMVILLDKKGREITRVGYEGGPVEKFAAILKNRFANYQKLSFDFEKNCSDEYLETLYQKASELGSTYYKEKILERGIAMPKGVFFQMERYAGLVNKGEKESAQAKEIREIILKRDPNNEKGSRLRLALIDFQEGEGEAKKVVEPLEIYIRDFGKGDADNLPKIHLLISEYLSVRANASIG